MLSEDLGQRTEDNELVDLGINISPSAMRLTGHYTREWLLNHNLLCWITFQPQSHPVRTLCLFDFLLAQRQLECPTQRPYFIRWHALRILCSCFSFGSSSFISNSSFSAAAAAGHLMVFVYTSPREPRICLQRIKKTRLVGCHPLLPFTLPSPSPQPEIHIEFSGWNRAFVSFAQQRILRLGWRVQHQRFLTLNEELKTMPCDTNRRREHRRIKDFLSQYIRGLLIREVYIIIHTSGCKCICPSTER